MLADAGERHGLPEALRFREIRGERRWGDDREGREDRQGDHRGRGPS